MSSPFKYPTPGAKLYKLEISASEYVLADSEAEAEAKFRSDIDRGVLSEVHQKAVDVFTREVRYRDEELAEGWTPDVILALEYGPDSASADGSVTLGDALAKLPTRKEASEAEDTHDEESLPTPKPWGTSEL